MIIKADEKAIQTIVQLTDLALKAGGVSVLNLVRELLDKIEKLEDGDDKKVERVQS